MAESLKMMPSIAQDTGLAALVASGMAGAVLGTGHLRTGVEALKEHKFKEGARRIYVNPEVFDMISSAAHELEDFQRLIDEEAAESGHLVPRNFNALTAGQPASNSSPAGSPGKGKLSSRGSAKGGQFAMLGQIRKRDPNLPKLQQLDIACSDQQEDLSPNGEQGAVSLGLHAPHHAGSTQPPYSPDRRRPRFGALSPGQEAEDAGPLRRPRNGGAASWMTALKDQRKQAEQQAKAQAEQEQADAALSSEQPALDGTITEQAGLPHDDLQGVRTHIVPVIDLTTIQHSGGYIEDDGMPSNPLSSIRGKSTVRLKPLYVDKEKLDTERSQQLASARKAADSQELSRRAALAEQLQGFMTGGNKQQKEGGVNFESSSNNESSDETTSGEDESDDSSSTNSSHGRPLDKKFNRRGLIGKVPARATQPQQGAKQDHHTVDEMQRRRALLKLASMGSSSHNKDYDGYKDDSCEKDHDSISSGSQQQATDSNGIEQNHGLDSENSPSQTELSRKLSHQGSSHERQATHQASGLLLPLLDNPRNDIAEQQVSDCSTGAGLPKLKRTFSIAPTRSAPTYVKTERAASVSNIAEVQPLSRIMGDMSRLADETPCGVPSPTTLKQILLGGDKHRQQAMQSSASQPSVLRPDATKPRTRSATRGRPAAFQPDWRPAGNFVKVCAPRMYERVSWAGRESQIIPKDRPGSATACPGCIKPSWRPAGHDGPLSRLYTYLTSDAPATVEAEASHASHTSKKHGSCKHSYGGVASWRPVGQAGSGFGPRLKSNPGLFVEPPLAADRSQPKYGRWRDAGMAGHLSLDKTLDWGTYLDPASNPFARSDDKVTLPEANRLVGPEHVKPLKTARSKVSSRLPMNVPVIISAPETYEEVEDVVMMADSGKQDRPVHAQVVTLRSYIDGQIICRMVRIFKPSGGNASQPQWVEIPIPLVGELPQQASYDSLSPTTACSLQQLHANAPLTTRSMYVPSSTSLLDDQLKSQWSRRTLGPCRASCRKDMKPRANHRSYQAKARPTPHLFIVPKANHPALLGALQAEASTRKPSHCCMPSQPARIDALLHGKTVPDCKSGIALTASKDDDGGEFDGGSGSCYDKPDPNSPPIIREAVDFGAADNNIQDRWQVQNLEHPLPTAFSPLLADNSLLRPSSLHGKSHLSHIEGWQRISQSGVHPVARCSLSGRPFSRLGLELARAVDSPHPPSNMASRLALECARHPTTPGYPPARHSEMGDAQQPETHNAMPASRMSMFDQGHQRMISTPLHTVAVAAAQAELRNGSSQQGPSLMQSHVPAQAKSAPQEQQHTTLPACLSSCLSSPHVPSSFGTQHLASCNGAVDVGSHSLLHRIIPSLRGPKPVSVGSSIAFRTSIGKLAAMSMASLACTNNKDNCRDIKQRTNTGVHIPACMPHHLLPIPFTAQHAAEKRQGHSLLPRVQQVLMSADMRLKLPGPWGSEVQGLSVVPSVNLGQQQDEHANRFMEHSVSLAPEGVYPKILAPLHYQAGAANKQAKLLAATAEAAVPVLDNQPPIHAQEMKAYDNQSVQSEGRETAVGACSSVIKDNVQQMGYSYKDTVPMSHASLDKSACSASHFSNDQRAVGNLSLRAQIDEYLGLCSSWMPVQQRQKLNIQAIN